jgi:hypothetical protein
VVPFLLTPREHHNVSSLEEYRERQAATIAERRRRGARYELHDVETPIEARVDAGTWLVDCECGAGNATDPAWGVACCFGCGAIHTTVVFPAPRTCEAIERLLVARPKPIDRAWRPGESLVDLMRENRDHGFDIPVSVEPCVHGGDA